MRWVGVLAALLFAGVSAYGWWSYFGAGPAHESGLQFGLIGAMLAAVALFLATIAARPPRD
jgi:hypothetical protein